MLQKKRNPFIFVENTKITINKDKILHIGEEVFVPQQYTCLVLGKECFISSEAAIEISKHNTILAFSHNKLGDLKLTPSKGYRINSLRKKQLLAQNNKKVKLSIAKKLIKLRNKEIPKYLQKIKIASSNTNSLMLAEAVWSKSMYKKIARHHGQIWISRKYALKNKPALFIINRFLYTLSYLAIISIGMDPNLSILHNGNSGMGLALDLADIFKTSLYSEMGFDKIPSNEQLIKVFDEKRIFNKMIKCLENAFS